MKTKAGVSTSQEVPNQATMDMMLELAKIESSATGDWTVYHNLVKRYAKLENAEAENVLGLMYLDGVGVEQDSALGIGYLEKSTAHGGANAPFNLGIRYELGKNGLNPDPVKAFALYKVAAERGLNRAQYNVCNMLINGDAVKEDLVLAKSYCKAAVENGFIEAWQRYALIAALENNFILSFELASQGVQGKDFGAAEFVGKLAMMLLPQAPLKQDPPLRQAMKTACEAAAKLGDTRCPEVLAVLDPASPQAAYSWYLVAQARTGAPLSAEALRLERSLTASQRQSAKVAADELIANTPPESAHCRSCSESNFGQL